MDKFEFRNSNFEILLCERRVSAVKYFFGCNESRWAFRGDEVTTTSDTGLAFQPQNIVGGDRPVKSFQR